MSGRQASSVVAHTLADGSYLVQAVDDDAHPVGRFRIVEVGLREGDDDVTAGQRTSEVLSEAALALGVRVGPWGVVGTTSRRGYVAEVESERPALVTATVLTDEEGDFRLDVLDKHGRRIGSPLVVDAALRPGDVAPAWGNPANLRWRALNEAARTLGVTIDGWDEAGPEHDGATYVTRVVGPYPLPPVTCAPWCQYGDGHTDALAREDQACSSPRLDVNGLTVFLERPPGEPVTLHVTDGGRPVVDVTPTVARASSPTRSSKPPETCGPDGPLTLSRGSHRADPGRA